MTDHEQLETMLRSSLTERAGDVDTTPALYERVQRQATRGTWLRRGFALAGAAAAVVVAVAVIPPLLPAGPLEPDIADTPEDAAPTDAAPPSLEAQLLDAGLAFATDLSSGGSSLQIGDRVVTSPVRIVSLAASPFWNADDGKIAAGREDGSIIIVDQLADGGDEADVVLDATANGGGVAFAPAGGDALAWIEGTDLHVLPVAGQPEGERSLPLQGDVPDDLRIEQWFYGADAQVILASDPGGGVWRIPMDDSDPFDTDVTGPASIHPDAEEANDALILPDLQLVATGPNTGEGLALSIGGELRPVPGLAHDSEAIELSGPAGQMIAMLDPGTGRGVVQSVTENASGGVLVATWESPRISAVVPTLPLARTGAGTLDPPAPSDDETSEAGGSDETDGGATLLDELGLRPLPLVGTRGTDLLVVDAVSGSETVVPVYPAESEATLGLLDVRPGSTVDDAVVAYENFSEGETSIRFLALRDGEVELLDGLVVTDAPLTGLVWSPDAMHVLWTTEAGAVGVADVTTADGTISTSSLDELAGEGLVATDWTWDDGDPSGDAEGHLWFSTGQGAEGSTELVSVARPQGAGVTVVDAERQVLRGVAVSPVAGSSVSLQEFEGRLELLLVLDDDRLQYLPLPAFLEEAPDTWSNIAMAGVDGSVVIWTDGGPSFEVRLNGAGEVRNLPDTTAWTPVG